MVKSVCLTIFNIDSIQGGLITITIFSAQINLATIVRLESTLIHCGRLGSFVH